MPLVRGRPVKLDHKKIDEAIILRKSEVVENNKIISKSNDIWKILSEALNVAPSALYTYVTCNRNNIRYKLLDSALANESTSNVTTTDNETEVSVDSVSDESIRDDTKVRIIDLHYSRAEFAALLETKSYKRTEKTRANTLRRNYTVLKRGLWENSVTEKLWEKSHIKCGFNYKTHKISATTCSFSTYGSCKCGATITGKILIFPCPT